MRHLSLLVLALSFAVTPLLAGDEPLRVGGNVKAPIVTSRVYPHYPAEAKEKRIGGMVMVELMIDRTGAVKSAKVLKGLPYGLSEAALEAVKQWKFRPATRDGQPVDVLFTLPMEFRLDGGQPAMSGGPVVGASITTMSQTSPVITTVILVRHAEKETDPALKDPPLTEAGQRRAAALARHLASAHLDAVLTTPYARTRLTAAPVAAAAGLMANEMKSGPTYAKEVAQWIRMDHQGQTVLIVGHSNTTPDVLRALGIANAPEIPESEYDNLYVVTLAPPAAPRLLTLKY